MKKLLGIISIMAISFLGINIYAQEVGNESVETHSKRVNQDVGGIVESVGGLKSKVQNTEFNKIEGGGIQGTLASVAELTTPYINWMIYIGLASAIILIIFNGLLIVLAPANDSNVSKVKSRMTYIVMGIVVLTGSAIIIRIVLGIVNNLF